MAADMDKKEFLSLLEQAHVGDRLIYHRGMLCNDRLRNRDADVVGELAWLAGAPRIFGRLGNDGGLGLGELAQRRIIEDGYEYALTIKRRIGPDEIAYLRAYHKHAA